MWIFQFCAFLFITLLSSSFVESISCKVNMISYLLQLDVTSSQLLVTDSDFRNEDFRKQLSETVQSLLALKVIPIFNENDAISTRRAPYEVFIYF